MTNTTPLFDQLETRRHFAVSLDANGWTSVTPASDTRMVYVSNSLGNDKNDGLSTGTPVKTLEKAKSLIRNNSADWLLLKRGDTFETFGEWRLSGRSEQEPILISAYGSGLRPQINSGSGPGFITYGKGGASGRSIDNIVITSLSMTPNTYNHTNGTMNTGGIRLLCQGKNITIEDCKIYGYKENIDIAGSDNGLRNVTIRRNVIADAHSSEKVGHAHGIWMGGKTNGVVVEENVLDHNGWRDGRSDDRVFFNHNIYVLNGAKNVVIKNNLITRASFYGIKMNGGGVAENNFFARNAESIYLEDSAVIKSNVITEASSMPQQNWGVGINTQKAPWASIIGNLITTNNNDNAAGVAGIQLYNNGTAFSGTVEDNIVYNWRNALRVATPGKGNGSVVIRNNDFQLTDSSSAAVDLSSKSGASTFDFSGNRYYSTQGTGPNRLKGSFVGFDAWSSKTGDDGSKFQKVSYPDPDRSIAAYAKRIGAGDSFESFIEAARSMDKSNWNSAFMAASVNAWFRAGFGIGQDTPPPSNDPDPTPEPEPAVVQSGRFSNLRAPQAITLQFSGDLDSKPKAGSLSIVNLTNGKTYVAKRVVYDATTHTARFVFKGLLPDGQYSASYGSEYSLNFVALTGDATGDGKVNTSDFNVLAGSFGGTSRTFTQGDFDYDGTVTSNDFNIFLSQHGKKVEKVTTPPPLALTVSSSPFSKADVTHDKDEPYDAT
jgi:hypothetical protein